MSLEHALRKVTMGRVAYLIFAINGKPDGMLGAEIWSKVGAPAPASDSDFSMVALDTASPYVVNYPMEDAGKQVWYRMRWVATSGDKGPWGETAEATINK